MRIHQIYGRLDDEDGLPLPVREGFRYRALEIGPSDLRLCDRCLLSWRHCWESPRRRHNERSWKRHRRTRYRSR